MIREVEENSRLSDETAREKSFASKTKRWQLLLLSQLWLSSHSFEIIREEGKNGLLLSSLCRFRQEYIPLSSLEHNSKKESS
jgi:hypothetical protein